VVVAAAIAAAVRDLISGALGGLSYGRLIANVVSVFIIALGVIAALNQVGIATTVTTPVLVAVLATIAGILIVGVGGGLVRPMQRRWEGWLERMAAESAVIRERARAYQEERAEQERRRVEEERRRADEREAAAAAARASDAAPTAPVPPASDAAPTAPVASSADMPPAPGWPPAGSGAHAAPAVGDDDAGERTQVIPRADIAAAASPRPDGEPGPVAGTTPPAATREMPAVDGDDGALDEGRGGPRPSEDGSGPVRDDEQTQVIKRQR
jgi:hypothetical protein